MLLTYWNHVLGWISALRLSLLVFWTWKLEILFFFELLCDRIWCPFVPAGCPGNDFVATGKRAIARLNFFWHGQGGQWVLGGRAGKSGHGHARLTSLLVTVGKMTTFWLITNSRFYSYLGSKKLIFWFGAFFSDFSDFPHIFKFSRPLDAKI